jgi:hypothetical protein
VIKAQQARPHVYRKAGDSGFLVTPSNATYHAMSSNDRRRHCSTRRRREGNFGYFESNDGPRRARLTFVAGVFNEASQTNSPTMCELVWPARVFGSLPARVPDSLSSVMD